MAEGAHKLDPRLRLSESLSLYALFVLAVACVLLLCAAPRPLAPTELPGLRLPEAAVRAVLAQDARDEHAAPKSTVAMELERLFLEHGESEDRATDSAKQRSARKLALAAAYAELVRQEGALAGVRMRARELAKLEAALSLRLPDEQVKGVIGVFPNALEQHAVTRQGVEVAPHFVLRTLYKVRFNLAVGQPVDLAFADVERAAYRGWLALRAEHLPIQRRLRELAAYADAAGPSEAARAAEADGVLLYRSKAFAEAERSLSRAQDLTGSIRLRNYALAARLSAEAQDPARTSANQP